jgi:2-(1,2-epoxy-1,2-dihydrophenyl)acetyl-CoA isomerase
MTTPHASEGVAIESRDGVLRITLDRPSRKNSLDPPSVRRIVTALEAAATDDALRVVVLAGNGPDFCSGADWVASNAAATHERAACSGGPRSRRIGSSSC